MRVNFIGNFQAGYVGEVGDANHLAKEIEMFGNTVRRIPQDAWREYVIEGFPKDKYDVPEDLKADINIVCKWHHFYDGMFIEALKEQSGAPVLYWVWDFMDDQGIPDWHKAMVEASDLYLGNDVRDQYYKIHDNAYYFPFDVADKDIERFRRDDFTHEVSFFGSWIGQGDRQEWLKEINKTNPITVFSWNHQDWPEEFEDVHPPVYGIEFTKAVSTSKICLGFSVEPNCWGYWSNRTGKTLLAGGFLLQQYAPGMELFLKNGVEYFSSVEEAQEKIDHYLIAEYEREAVANIGWLIGQDNFTSKARVRQLLILAERFIKTNGTNWQL